MDHFRLTWDVQYLTDRECVSLTDRFDIHQAFIRHRSEKSQKCGAPHVEEGGVRWLISASQSCFVAIIVNPNRDPLLTKRLGQSDMIPICVRQNQRLNVSSFGPNLFEPKLKQPHVTRLSRIDHCQSVISLEKVPIGQSRTEPVIPLATPVPTCSSSLRRGSMFQGIHMCRSPRGRTQVPRQ